MLNRIDRWWAAAILFANGWMLALPVAEGRVPVWFTPVQVVHGVFVHEILLLAYLAFAILARGGYLPVSTRRDHNIGILIAALGALAILSACANLRPLREFAAAGRYFLLAAYFLLAIYWTARHGPKFVLRNYLFGMAAAGAINLYYTFSIKFMELSGLPLLLGQNGPGGYLGMSVILSAWLMLERRSWRDAAIAMAAGVIGFIATSISFSKLAMLMSGAGAIAWCFVMLRDFNAPRLRRWYAVLFVALMAVLWIQRDVATRYVKGVNAFIEYKFRNIDPDSIRTRSQYFVITAEIMSRHPLFGVGYGGFYDAVMATEAYKSDRSAKEDPEAGARGESNPHSSFLYYASANGLPGLLLALLLLTIALQVLRRSLSRHGTTGKLVWACLAFGYLIFGLTLPTLFNSSILYLPVAVAVCSSVRRHVRRTLSRRVYLHLGGAPDPSAP